MCLVPFSDNLYLGSGYIFANLGHSAQTLGTKPYVISPGRVVCGALLVGL